MALFPSSSAYPEGSREKVAKPDDAGFDMPYEEHDLTAPDGTKLKTYLMLTEEKRVGPDVSLLSLLAYLGRRILLPCRSRN